MQRVTRVWLGLLSLLPVAWLAGWAGLEGEAAAWVVFGVVAVWLVLPVMCDLRVPARLSPSERGCYLGLFFRHTEYEETDGS